MAFKTLLQVTSKINRDLDLEAEEFIQPTEMIEYINDGITIIEAHLNTLGIKDRYFLTRTTINLVQGTADYALPTNIYEDKIKEIAYKNGSNIYTLDEISSDESLADIELTNVYGSGMIYRYRIRNDSSTAKYLQLIPAARESVTGGLVVEYFRDIERVDSDADLIELPDIAVQYLYQFVKVKVYEKETHVNYQAAVGELLKLEQLMLETLRGQTADPDRTLIDLDITAYEEAT